MSKGMRSIIASIILLTGGVSSLRDIPEASIAKSSTPWFCRDLDCPKYKVVNTTDKYEVRQYEAETWVQTKVEALLFSVGAVDGFKRLFNYISGKNEEHKKIEMTTPVVTNVVPGEGPFCKSIFTTSFFVPYAYQDNPPKPSESDVHIYKAQHKATVAVLQFGGFLIDDFTLNSKAKTLQGYLKDNKVEYDNSSFFSVGYDPPYRLQHRHNEIWIRLTGNSVDEVTVA